MALEIEGELLDLAVMGIGAGAKGIVTGYIKNFMPGVTEDIAAIIAGGALYYFGENIHPLVKKFGAGILIAGIGQMTKGMMPAPTPAASPMRSPQTSSDQLGALAQMQASRQAVYS